jgi:hypothetical protein
MIISCRPYAKAGTYRAPIRPPTLKSPNQSARRTSTRCGTGTRNNTLTSSGADKRAANTKGDSVAGGVLGTERTSCFGSSKTNQALPWRRRRFPPYARSLGLTGVYSTRSPADNWAALGGKCTRNYNLASTPRWKPNSPAYSYAALTGRREWYAHWATPSGTARTKNRRNISNTNTTLHCRSQSLCAQRNDHSTHRLPQTQAREQKVCQWSTMYIPGLKQRRGYRSPR